MANVYMNLVGTADFAPIYRQVHALNAAFAELNAAAIRSGTGFSQAQLAGLKSARNTFLDTTRAVAGYETQVVSVTGRMAGLTSEFARGKLHISDYFGMMRKGSNAAFKDMQAMSLQQAKIASSMVVQMQNGQAAVITGARTTHTVAAQAVIDQQMLNSAWQQGTTKLINLGKNTQWAGRQLMVGFTMPVMALGGALAAMYYQLDKNITMLKRVYGIGGSAGGPFRNVLPSDAEIQDISNKVIALSGVVARTYGISAKETTSVAAAFAAAGYTQQKLLDMTATATKAMALGDTTQEESVKAAIALQNTYKISTQDVGDAMNFFSAAQAATSTNMKDLIDAIPRVGPVVKNLGGSYKDLVALIVSMKEGGVAAGEGANAIKNSLQRIISPTQKAQETLAGFGINLKTIVQTNAGNLIGTIEELQQKLSSLDNLSRQRALTELFGKYQAARMSALFDNFNKMGTQSAKIMEMQTYGAKQLADIAQHETEQMQKTGYGAFKIAFETLKTQLLPVGDQFLSIITQIVKGISWFVEAVKFIAPYKNLLLGGLIGVAIAGPILMLSGLFMNLVGQFGKLINFARMFKQSLQLAFMPTEAQKIYFTEMQQKNMSFFRAFSLGMNNYFKEIDKSQVASQKLGRVMDEAAKQQAGSVDIIRAAIERYINAVNRMAGATAANVPVQAAHGLAVMANAGLARAVINPGATAPAPVGAGATSGVFNAIAAQSSLSMARIMNPSNWSVGQKGLYLPEQKMDSKGNPTYAPKTIHETTKVGTLLMPTSPALTKMNSAGGGTGHVFVAENYNQELALRKQFIAKLMQINADLSEEDKLIKSENIILMDQTQIDALISGQKSKLNEKLFNVLELTDSAIVSQNKLFKIEATHLTYAQMLADDAANAAAGGGQLVEEYRRLETEFAKLTQSTTDQAQLLQYSVDYQSKLNGLFQGEIGYQERIDANMEELTVLKDKNYSNEQVIGRLQMQHIGLMLDLQRTAPGVIVSWDRMGASLRLAAQGLEGYYVALTMDKDGHAKATRWHWVQNQLSGESIMAQKDLIEVISKLILSDTVLLDTVKMTAEEFQLNLEKLKETGGALGFLNSVLEEGIAVHGNEADAVKRYTASMAEAAYIDATVRASINAALKLYTESLLRDNFMSEDYRAAMINAKEQELILSVKTAALSEQVDIYAQELKELGVFTEKQIAMEISLLREELILKESLVFYENQIRELRIFTEDQIAAQVELQKQELLAANSMRRLSLTQEAYAQEIRDLGIFTEQQIAGMIRLATETDLFTSRLKQDGTTAQLLNEVMDLLANQLRTMGNFTEQEIAAMINLESGFFNIRAKLIRLGVFTEDQILSIINLAEQNNMLAESTMKQRAMIELTTKTFWQKMIVVGNALGAAFGTAYLKTSNFITSITNFIDATVKITKTIYDVTLTFLKGLPTFLGLPSIFKVLGNVVLELSVAFKAAIKASYANFLTSPLAAVIAGAESAIRYHAVRFGEMVSANARAIASVTNFYVRLGASKFAEYLEFAGKIITVNAYATGLIIKNYAQIAMNKFTEIVSTGALILKINAAAAGLILEHYARIAMNKFSSIISQGASIVQTNAFVAGSIIKFYVTNAFNKFSEIVISAASFISEMSKLAGNVVEWYARTAMNKFNEIIISAASFVSEMSKLAGNVIEWYARTAMNKFNEIVSMSALTIKTNASIAGEIIKYYSIKAFNKFSEIVSLAALTIKINAQAVGGIIMSYLKPAFMAAKEEIISGFSLIKAAAKSYAMSLVEGAVFVSETTVDTFYLFKSYITSSAKIWATRIESVATFIAQTVVTVVEPFGALIIEAGRIISNAAKNLATAISQSAAWKLVSAAGQRIASAATFVSNGIRAGAKDVGAFFGRMGTSVVKFGGQLAGVGAKVVSGFSRATSNIVEGSTTLGTAIKTSAVAARRNTTTVVQNSEAILKNTAAKNADSAAAKKSAASTAMSLSAEEKKRLAILSRLLTEEQLKYLMEKQTLLTRTEGAALQGHINALDIQIKDLQKITKLTDEQGASLQKLIEEQNRAADRLKGGVEGRMSGFNKGLGRAGMGIGMASMLAPMMTEPMGESMGGTTGGAIKGAGQGAMYGGMVGMMGGMIPVVGPFIQVLAPIVGAAIGGIKGYVDAANEEIRKREADRAAVIASSYNISGQALDQFNVKMHDFGAIHLTKAGNVMSANADIVDQLSAAYASATDTQTTSYLDILKKQRIGTPAEENSWWQSMLQLGDLTSEANKNTPLLQKMFTGGLLSTGLGMFGIHLGSKGGPVGPKDAEKADLEAYSTSLTEKYWTDIVGGMTSQKAETDILAVAKAAGDEGFGTLNLATSLSNSLKNQKQKIKFAFSQLLGSSMDTSLKTYNQSMDDVLKYVGTDSQGLTDFVGNNPMTPYFLNSNSSGGFSALTKPGESWSDVAKSKYNITDQAQLDAIGKSQTAWNDMIKSSSQAMMNAIKQVDPSTFQDLTNTLSDTQKEVVYSDDSFRTLVEDISKSNKQLGDMMNTLKDSGVPIKQVYDALNLMSAGLIRTQEELLAVARSSTLAASITAAATQKAKIDTAMGGDQAAIIKQMVANANPALGTASSTAGGGDSGPTPEEKAIQDSIDARQKSIDSINKELDARQKLYDAKQKSIQQDLTMLNLSNDIASARASGDLLQMAKAQSAYNAERNSQAALAKKEEADAANKAEIDKYNAQIKTLQDKLAIIQQSQQGGSSSGASTEDPLVAAQRAQKLLTLQAQAVTAQEGLQAIFSSVDQQTLKELSAPGGAAKNELTKGFYDTLQGATGGNADSYIQQLLSQGQKENPLTKKNFLATLSAKNVDLNKFHKSMFNINKDIVDFQAKADIANEIAKVFPDIQTETTQHKMDEIDGIMAVSAFAKGSAEYLALQQSVADLFGLKTVNIKDTQAKAEQIASAIKTKFGLTSEQANEIAITYTNAVVSGLDPKTDAITHTIDSLSESMGFSVTTGIQDYLSGNAFTILTKPLDLKIHTIFDPIEYYNPTTGEHITRTPSQIMAGLVIPTGFIPFNARKDGGIISGIGGPTDDLIPTMLSNGEYVIRASSVSRYGQQMLDMINSGNYSPKFNSPTARSNYSTGGLVGESSSMSNVEYNINVNVAGSNASPDDIARAVLNTIKQKDASNMTRRNIG